MTMLFTGAGSRVLTVPRGSSLVVRNMSGTETVTGSSSAREDASSSIGGGYVVYGPQSSDSTITLSTTGALDYQVVAGDPTPTSGAVFVPALPTTEGIIAAAQRARDAGGGEVDISNIQCQLTQPLPMYSGVVYRGNAGMPTTTQAASDYYYSLGFTQTGTVLTGDGTFNGFQYNHTDLASFNGGGSRPPQSEALYNAGIIGVCLDNFLHGIKIGALKNIGAASCVFERIMVKRATKWAVHFENFMHTRFDWLILDTPAPWASQEGNAWFGASGGAYDFGNSNLGRISASNHNPAFQRNLVICGRSGGSLNDFVVEHPVVTTEVQLGDTAPFTSTASGITITNGTDAAKVAAGSWIYTATDAGGLNAYKAYVVKTKVGNLITVGTSYGGAAISTSNGSGTLILSGPPLIEIIGIDGSTVHEVSVHHGDVENRAIGQIYIENATAYVDLHVHNPGRDGANASTFILRNNAFASLRSLKSHSVDMGAGEGCKAIRIGEGSVEGRSGMWDTPRGLSLSTSSAERGFVNGGMVVSLQNGPTMGPMNGAAAALYIVKGLALQHLEHTTGNLPDEGIVWTIRNDNAVVSLRDISTDLAGATFNVGETVWIQNATGTPITITCRNAARLFWGGGQNTATSVTVPPYSSMRFTASRKNTTLFWWFDAPTSNGGTSTQNGTGSQTVFTIPHGLAVAPTKISVNAGSAAAAAAFFVTRDATNITVTFLAAPASGTGNVVLHWTAAP